MSSERHRITFLIQRDGYAKTRNWVEKTLGIYREAVSSPGSHASQPEFRPHFDKAIAEFQAWLNRSTPDNAYGPYEKDQPPVGR